MRRYYSNLHVQARMLEFLGGHSVETVTCEYVTAGDANAPRHREPRAVSELPKFWQEELDISRSLWDHTSLIFDVDLEYVNFDAPAEAYVHPERMFELQRPVECAIEAILLDYGIRPLHLLSGRGHHYLWRIRLESEAFRRLVQVAHVPPSLATLNARAHRPHGVALPPRLGEAFSGSALVIEYLAHRIKEEAAPMSEVPVELTAVEVGPRHRDREMISIDISEYGDPLSTRVVRVPFSLYLKPQQQRGILGEGTVRSLPPVVCIPLERIDSRQGAACMHDLRRVEELARCSSTTIPDATDATVSLVRAYEKSSLRRFHDWYYAEQENPGKGAPADEEVCWACLPPCVRHVVEHPNDLLLRPANLRRTARVLMALGWHPRRVAGWIRSRFERDYGWGHLWAGYDPGTRADFYTRIFAGPFVTGEDDLIDLNCQSVKEAKLCFADPCAFNLERHRRSLLDRRQHERLACRPFHRLFLPEEHL